MNLPLYLVQNIYLFTITTATLRGETRTKCTIHTVLDGTSFKGQDFIYENHSLLVTELLVKCKTDSLLCARTHIMKANMETICA